MERCLIIVARDQPERLAQLAFLYADEPSVEVCSDRRVPPRPDTDLYGHGFIAIPRP